MVEQNIITPAMCDSLYQEMSEKISSFEGLDNSYRYILENSSIDPKLAVVSANDPSSNLVQDSVNTTERKAFYEHREIEYIEKVYFWTRFVYWVMFVILVACIVLIYKQINLYSGLVIFLFAIYPFVEKYIVRTVRQLFEFILSLFNHNTYVAL